MPRKITKAQRVECLRLRNEEQHSTPVIARKVGISNFSTYRILRGHPWIGIAQTKRTWSMDEMRLLKRLWPSAELVELLEAFPKRNLVSIGRKASSLGIKRQALGLRKNSRPIHPIISALRAERERRSLTRVQLSEKCGYHWQQLQQWENGKAQPMFRRLIDWAAALDMEVIMRSVKARVLDERPLTASKSQLMAGR